jgi:ribose transport system ATP-binding protein
MTAGPRFEMRGVRKAFGSTIALAGVDLSVDAGEICALIGQNGAGKSTLMGILSGALAADAGEMRLDGKPYAPRSPIDGRRRGVAMIYQALSLAPHLSVMENIALGAEPLRWGIVDREAMRRRAEAALADLGHADIRPGTLVGTLGPAAQQLVEIARALASGCRVLVLDEPTSSLGQADVSRLFEILERLRRQGLAIVYISHFIEEVQAISDRYVVMRDGRIVGKGTTEGTDASSIVALMVGQSIDNLYPRGDRLAGDAVLHLGDLIPGHASLTLHRGEVVGIAGLVGAGRTRLLRAIFGLEPVRSGRIRVAAFEGPRPPAIRWRQGVGMVSEDRTAEGLALDLSVADNLTLSNLRDAGPAFFVSPSRLATLTEKWIARLGVRADGPWQRVSALSGGNQQKIALARLLCHDVDVLLLDEPSRGIDVASKARIYQLIDDVVTDRSRPRAVLLVSSYLPELLGVCDRIAVMARGRLGPARPADEWTEHGLLMAASGVETAPLREGDAL